MPTNPHPAETSYDGEFIDLIGPNKNDNLELVEELFTGNLAKWAAKRGQVLGDYVMPKIIYVEVTDEGPHKVAWVEHKGTNGATFESFHNHHVVCECILCKNFNDGTGGIDTTLCEVMGHALEARADLVGAGFRQSIDISQSHSTVNLLTGSPEAARQFDLENMSLSALEQVLHLDHAHPEGWQGNAVSGVLPVEQAGKIIAQPLEMIFRCAELLQRSRKVDFDGESLRLAA
ncbi:hypothetical protein KW794_02650 [Candidatus Saccharibacteria bacterium]|nr:hypothetical protein [Candidatus Saccharibacteria bacterium]